MTLEKYKDWILSTLLKGIKFEYDKETNQYSLINNETPGIFWLGDTKKEAIQEYLSWFMDNILINENIKDEISAIA
jgi:hypothetical protein